jgi:hypothetical protein
MKFSKNISMNMLILFFVVAMGLFIWLYYSNKLHEGSKGRSSQQCSNADPDKSKCNTSSIGISHTKCNGKNNKIFTCTKWGWQ